jgi:hypothetical protein
VRDRKFEGRNVEASRLGFRITGEFVQRFFGRVFADAASVFPENMLRPELQSEAEFADGVEHIVEGQRKAALFYFEDGSVELAIPPLQALLHIMAHGSWQGCDVRSEKVRSLFTRESVVSSSWYRDRLAARNKVEGSLWQRHVNDLQAFLAAHANLRPSDRALMAQRLADAQFKLSQLAGADALTRLEGTLGVDPTLHGASASDGGV